MNKIVFLYPGQGAQKPGMGKDFYENSEAARDLFVKASQAVGLDLQALCFEENDKLDQTEYTQVAMVATCLAMTSVLKERGLKPDITAGLSLGEYCAISAAGGMEEIDAIRLVRTRGILMQNAVPKGQGAMAAVLGMNVQKIEEIIQEVSEVYIANYNCPGQIVITGKAKEVELASAKLKEGGAKRVLPLNVSGPFHSPLLREAGKKLRKELDETTIRPLQIPYVTNVSADYVYDSSKTRALLEEQVASSVRWQESMETILEKESVENVTFVEIGPGTTLSGFMKKIAPAAQIHHVGAWEDVEQVVKEIKGE